MKKIVLFLFVIFLMMGECGCGMKNTKAVVLSHLESKYGGSFEMISFHGRNIDMPYDEIVMQDQYGNKFYVYIEKDDNGKEVIKDQYYGILKEDEYAQIVRDILDKYLQDYKFFPNFTASFFDNKYDGEYALSDALREEKYQFFSNNYIFMSEDNLRSVSESTFDELTKELENNGFSMFIAIHSVSSEELNNIDETKDVNNFLPDDYPVDPVYEKTIM